MKLFEAVIQRLENPDLPINQIMDMSLLGRKPCQNCPFKQSIFDISAEEFEYLKSWWKESPNPCPCHMVSHKKNIVCVGCYSQYQEFNTLKDK